MHWNFNLIELFQTNFLIEFFRPYLLNVPHPPSRTSVFSKSIFLCINTLIYFRYWFVFHLSISHFELFEIVLFIMEIMRSFVVVTYDTEVWLIILHSESIWQHRNEKDTKDKCIFSCGFNGNKMRRQWLWIEDFKETEKKMRENKEPKKKRTMVFISVSSSSGTDILFLVYVIDRGGDPNWFFFRL